jgi:hypothetical protein
VPHTFIEEAASLPVVVRRNSRMECVTEIQGQRPGTVNQFVTKDILQSCFLFTGLEGATRAEVQIYAMLGFVDVDATHGILLLQIALHSLVVQHMLLNLFVMQLAHYV